MIKINSQSGFTIIETLVAISILLLCVVGPMEIAAKSLNSAYYAKDQITAYYLAQEGIEKIRNLRDQAYLSAATSGWIPPVLNSCFSSDGCDIDVTMTILNPEDSGGNGAVVSCNDLANCKLKYDGTYNHVAGVDSKFTRVIKITKKITSSVTDVDTGAVNNIEDQIVISSTISWRVGFLGTTKTFTITESLLNWPPK